MSILELKSKKVRNMSLKLDKELFDRFEKAKKKLEKIEKREIDWKELFQSLMTRLCKEME